MNANEKIGLKLIGKNEEDLKIISAYLQDSIILIKDIVFLKKNKTFLMIANRFMWEDVEKGVFRKNKRIRCAIKFSEIFKVRSKNINQKNKNRPLECLAIAITQDLNNNYKIKFFFAGDRMITIVSETIDVVVHDLGEPWIVKYMPSHKI
tara:strand:- start:307 stop:756 length:450 start_codon:yes stop_codon:yes gene_type:complete